MNGCGPALPDSPGLHDVTAPGDQSGTCSDSPGEIHVCHRASQLHPGEKATWETV